jgi:hypothetical protein
MLTADPIQDMALADVCECPFRVNRVGLAARGLLAISPNKRTSKVRMLVEEATALAHASRAFSVPMESERGSRFLI